MSAETDGSGPAEEYISYAQGRVPGTGEKRGDRRIVGALDEKVRGRFGCHWTLADPALGVSARRAF